MKTSKASIVQFSIHAKSAAASWPKDRSWTSEVLWQGLHLGVLILAVLIGWLVSQDASTRVESHRGASYRVEPYVTDRMEIDPIKDARAFRYIAFGGRPSRVRPIKPVAIAMAPGRQPQAVSRSIPTARWTAVSQRFGSCHRGIFLRNFAASIRIRQGSTLCAHRDRMAKR